MRKRKASKAADTTLQTFKLYRDLDGFVHTPNGYLPKETYEAIRVLNPTMNFPAHEDLPPLTA